MKKFFADFKKFISRGNILDLAVGVIIGGAFGKIVTSLVNDMIMPLITWLFGANSLAELSVPLKWGTDKLTGEPIVTLAWRYGNFIQSIIDFLIISFFIFLFIRLMMKSQELVKDVGKKVKKGKLTKEQKAELKTLGINRKDKEAVKKYLAEKEEEKQRLEQEEAEKKKAEEELAKQSSPEYLLKEIRDLLKENAELRRQNVAVLEEKTEKKTKSKKEN